VKKAKMISLINQILNVHRFVRHKWARPVQKRWKNLGTWRYVTTFKYPYPTIPQILTEQYGLSWQDRIIVYVTKEIRTPRFNRYRTRFRKVFHGDLNRCKSYLKELARKRKK
jgi:hypothetical protein